MASPSSKLLPAAPAAGHEGRSYGATASAQPAGNSSSSEERTPLISDASDETDSKPSLLDRLTFGWLSPLLERGNALGRLEQDDLDALPLPSDCTTGVCMEQFDRRWREEQLRAERITEVARERQRREYDDEGHDSSEEKDGKEQENDSRRSSCASLALLTDDETATAHDEAAAHDEPPPFEPVNLDPIAPTEPSLSRALAKAFGREFLLAGLLKLVHDLLIFVGPYVLNRLIRFLRDGDAPLRRGLGLTAAVTISQLLMSFCLRHYFFHCYLTGLRVRTALVVSIYRKALSISAAERHHRSVGEVVNLISTDANRIQNLMTYLHAIWYSFIQIGLALYFLWGQLGASCLGGVAIIVVMMPITRAVAEYMGKMQKRLMSAKDDRVELNGECLGSMKVIKLQAWEESFAARLLRLRGVELDRLFDYVVANSLSIMLWNAVPLLVALATFAAYTLTGHVLDVASALTSLALFDLLRFPLTMLPTIINRIVEAGVSIARVQSFLLAKEHSIPALLDGDAYGIVMSDATFLYESQKPTFVGKSHKVAPINSGPIKVLAKDLHDTRWEVALLKAQLAEADQRIRTLVKNNNMGPASLEDGQANTSDALLALKRINFYCSPGKLIAVVGSVASGKSSLVNSILGDLKLIAGNEAVKGKLALFPQSPFIMNDTVRRNITFGSPDDAFDERRYERAIKACALLPDFKALPQGDQTLIGERGITLSGGQKARIAMARTVYKMADIYLLDDPLAAVDAHVATHLFQECIVKELLLGGGEDAEGATNKSSVILVTNAVQYLSSPAVNKIIVLEEGRIAEEGSFQELSKQGTLFSSFLSVVEDSKTDENDSYCDNEGNEEEDTALQDSLAHIQSTASLSAMADETSPELAKAIMPMVKTAHSPTSAKRKSLIKKSELQNERDNLINSPSEAKKPSVTGGEEREVGHVSWRVYLSWAEAAGGNFPAACVFFAIIVAYSSVEGLVVLSKWWLTHWSQHGGTNQTRFLSIYAIINLTTIVMTLGRLLVVMLSGLRASRSIYEKLLQQVLRASMSFFDTHPLGQVINRFSKDMYEIDENLVSSVRSYLGSLMSVISVIIVCSTVTPIFAICLVPIMIFYLLQQRYFTVTYREIKRIDSVCRSPLYALLGETLDGVATIRAFRIEPSLLQRMVDFVDKQQNAYYLTCAAQCWLAIRLELAGTLIISFACLCAVLQHGYKGGDENFAGLAGLSISFALSVTQSLNWSVRMSSDVEASFIAVERVNQYIEGLPLEASRETEIDGELRNRWPQKGQIAFRKASLRYREGLPRVLKEISFVIPGGSKVGIVGRTGGGKSTLVVALLRIVELDEGFIEVDNIDISQLGLKTLRSNIAIIPQDPVLFAGTVRSNLDPFNEHDDGRLKEVVDRVGLLKSFSRSSSLSSFAAIAADTKRKNNNTNQASGIRSLNSKVTENGSNLSVGQRQLLVIARALLSRSRIVVMDEATASIDAETDRMIQETMRTEFQDSTVLTIAHRINTIDDSDYILSMSDGRVVEFDRPAALLARGGLYKDLVDSWEKEHE